MSQLNSSTIIVMLIAISLIFSFSIVKANSIVYKSSKSYGTNLYMIAGDSIALIVLMFINTRVTSIPYYFIENGFSEPDIIRITMATAIAIAVMGAGVSISAYRKWNITESCRKLVALKGAVDRIVNFNDIKDNEKFKKFITTYEERNVCYGFLKGEHNIGEVVKVKLPDDVEYSKYKITLINEDVSDTNTTKLSALIRTQYWSVLWSGYIVASNITHFIIAYNTLRQL